MRHSRDEVIERTIQEFERLDRLVAGLTDEEWALPLPRSETKDPWTIKDGLAHITHWKADAARAIRREPVPAEERGLGINAGNRFVYLRWRDAAPRQVLDWHRQVQQQTLATLQAAPDKYFANEKRRDDWPFDLDGHSAYHRIHDIEQALAARREG